MNSLSSNGQDSAVHHPPIADHQSEPSAPTPDAGEKSLPISFEQLAQDSYDRFMRLTVGTRISQAQAYKLYKAGKVVVHYSKLPEKVHRSEYIAFQVALSEIEKVLREIEGIPPEPPFESQYLERPGWPWDASSIL